MECQIDATAMAHRALKRLKEIEPGHELVKIMGPEASDEDFIKKFWDKKEPWQNSPGSMVSMYVETKYFVAVRDYLKDEYGIEL